MSKKKHKEHTISTYVIYKSGRCAKCGSTNIVYGNTELDYMGQFYIYRYRCKECDSDGEEMYDLVLKNNTVKEK